MTDVCAAVEAAEQRRVLADLGVDPEEGAASIWCARDAIADAAKPSLDIGEGPGDSGRGLSRGAGAEGSLEGMAGRGPCGYSSLHHLAYLEGRAAWRACRWRRNPARPRPAFLDSNGIGVRK